MKGQSNLQTFFYLITAQIVITLSMIGYSYYMADLNCPQWQEYEQQTADLQNQYNQSSALNSIASVWQGMGIVFSGCSGIPWWIYLVVFIPMVIADIVYLVPFVGD